MVAVAADDLRAGGDRLLELAHVVLGVLGQVDLGQHAQRQADALAVDQRAVAADDAGGLHVLDALPARRARQADRGGELLHGLARIALQLGEQQHVVAVEIVHSLHSRDLENEILRIGRRRGEREALSRATSA